MPTAYGQGISWRVEYNDQGQIARSIDPAGRATQYTYTRLSDGSLHAVTEAPPEGAPVTWQFDADGKVETMKDGEGEVAYHYDNGGLLNAVDRKGSSPINYSYDDTGRLVELNIGNFYRLAWTYDFLGRIANIQTPAGIISYNYQTGQNTVVRSLPNGVRTTWKRQLNGELDDITHGFSKQLNAKQYSVLAQYQYSHGPDGRIAAINEYSGGQGKFTWQYAYDSMGRLVRATGPGGREYGYEYDQAGNRTKATTTGTPAQLYTYDWAGRLTSVDGKPVQYDACGNLTSATMDGVARKYAYRPDGRLAKAESGNESAEYRYDGNGKLVVRKSTSGETRFIPDPLSGIGHPLVIDEGGVRTLVIWEGDTPLALVRNGKVEWLLHDHLGSVRLVTDSQGKVSRTCDYDPFGVPVNAERSASLTPGFAGLFRDDLAGGYLTMARAYAPKLGGFLQPDPQKRMPTNDGNDISLFSYCGSDPLNYTDNNGTDRIDVEPEKIDYAKYSKIYDTPGFANRINQYIDEWVKANGKGPVSIFVGGMTLRLEEGEDYMNRTFGKAGERVIFIPSYESLGVSVAYQPRMGMFIPPSEPIGSFRPSYAPVEFFRYKINLPKSDADGNWTWVFRYLEDTFKTVIDREKPDRNLDLPSIWKRLEERGCPVVVSYHESGANHDLLKNVQYIINAALSGQRIPYIVPTSGSIGTWATMRLREANISISESVSDKNDFVKYIETPVWETGYEMLGWDIKQRKGREITLKDVVAGTVGTVEKLDNSLKYLNSELSKNDKYGIWYGLKGQIFAALPVSGKIVALNSSRKTRYNTDYHAKGEPHAELKRIQLQKLSEYEPVRVENQETSANAIPKPKREARDKLSKPDDNRYYPPFPSRDPDHIPIKNEEEEDRRRRQKERDELFVFRVFYPETLKKDKLQSLSPVGGVYLGGSGRMLEGMGELKGVRTDANGNLVIVGEEGGNIKLPPLRLDDVVTVFRSVYQNGEGPTVTIDPNPKDPHASPMVIRHSKATEDTYVGWVLYEADRLMKGYGQGVDNITQKDIASRVPGYANVLETTYFGGGNPQEAQKMGIWERFWIVPAESRRYEGSRKELTLFDVPLKVKTQKMRWQNGKLVDDLTGNSSPSAQAFTSWFTTNYDAIGGEQYLTPPKESGMTKPVPVFTELRRIALLTAVAEKLRDQGVPMPFWMHDYDVRKVPFEHVTPAMEVTRQRSSGSTIHTARVFGGVELSPESRSVKTYSTAGDVAKAPADIRNEVDRSVKLAERLERVITDAAPVPLTVNRVSDGNKEYKVVSIPGTETQALGPCRLDEVDLAVPIAGGSEIQLSRNFNSFFSPKGVLGHGWTMDLPRLQEVRIPGNREGGKVSYTMGYELLTPLNSVYARFKDIRPVKDLPGSTLQVPDAEGPFYGLATGKPDFFKNTETHKLLLKNGQEWHFTKAGDLIAIKVGGQVTAYERDAEGRVSRIASLIGGQLAGEIRLGYDGNNKLIKATGNSFDNKHAKPVEVTYMYDTMGRLAGVTSNAGTVGYNYTGSLVTAVTWTGKSGDSKPEILRSFQYNTLGQMVSEKAGNVTVAHTITHSPDGMTASSQESLNGGKESGSTTVMQYDRYMRPTSAVADGTSTTWLYPAAGGVQMTMTTPDKQTLKVVESPDGKSRTLARNGVPWIAAQFNNSGKLSGLSELGRSVLTQQWRQDGQLSRVETPVQGASLQYDAQGLLSSVMLHPADAGTKLSKWQETKVDRQGRPIGMKDYTGAHLQMSYDEWNGLSALVQQTPNGNYGYNIKRNGDGRIEAVNSSWGNTHYNYDSNGNIQKIVTTRGGRTATVNLDNGRIRSTTGFDGGQTSFDNHKDGAFAGMPRLITCANGLELAHNYDANNRLLAVNVGNTHRVRLEYDKLGRVIGYAWEPAKR